LLWIKVNQQWQQYKSPTPLNRTAQLGTIYPYF